MENGEGKGFLLEALTMEFESIAKDARKVFSRFRIYPGFPGVCYVLKEGIQIDSNIHGKLKMLKNKLI